MSRILQDLVDLLDLETIEKNIYRGPSRDLGGRSVFGGQVIGQALVAAGRTLEDQVPHSLHAYFLRPGDMALPIVYEVERVRDGRSFSTRRVHAIQHGQPILSMIASFQKEEGGLEHQAQMPDLPPPESLRSALDWAREWVAQEPTVSELARNSMLRELAIEHRPVQPWNPLRADTREPVQHIWFRADGTLPDNPRLHQCVLAYASDFNFLSTALLPHAKGWLRPDMVVASIDHALWFHRPVRVDDWLLYSMDSPSAQAARGFSRGSIFDRQGRLVASVAQESLMRHIQTP